MKNISSVHLRKQGKRALCQKVIELDYHLTDRVEAVSCRTCLLMSKKRNIKPTIEAKRFPAGLI